jgi:hypothetical protein
VYIRYLTWYLNPKFLSQECKPVKLAGTTPFLQCLNNKASSHSCLPLSDDSFQEPCPPYL